MQIPAASSYRPSDIDVDIGGSPTLYELDGRKLVGIGCKNGAYVSFDARSFEILAVRQLLPRHRDGSQIATVDPHGPDDPASPSPVVPNEWSNEVQGENYMGTYSTAAVCSSQGKLFIGLGGNNYHYLSPGIDASTTPFVRALDWSSLADAWPLDDGDPQRYAIAEAQESNPLYKMGGESGLSVPAVANDVLFMATTRVALYAFAAPTASCCGPIPTTSGRRPEARAAVTATAWARRSRATTSSPERSSRGPAGASSTSTRSRR